MKVWIQKSEEVVITDEQAKEVALGYLRRKFRHTGIKKFKGRYCVYDYDSRFNLEDIIRPATKEDRELYDMIKWFEDEKGNIS